MSHQSRFAIYMIVDENFFAPAYVQAINILKIDHYDIHLFIEDTDDKILKIKSKLPPKIPNNLFLRFNQISHLLPDNLPSKRHLPPIVYLRIFAPFVLTAYDKLLHLDADIHITGSLSSLEKINFENFTLAAVHDATMGVVLPKNTNQSSADYDSARLIPLTRIGVNTGRYFNAGVMLINRKKWIEFDYYAELQKYFSTYADSAQLLDQDFLNYFFQKQWLELSPTWNFQGRLIVHGLAVQFDPVLIHYTANSKPWHWGHFDLDDHSELIYRNLADQAGLHQIDFQLPKYSKNLSPLKIAKIRFHKWLFDLGIESNAARKKIKAWSLEHRHLVEFYERRIRSNIFADGHSKTLKFSDIKKLQPVFNGRIVVGKQYPDSAKKTFGTRTLTNPTI